MATPSLKLLLWELDQSAGGYVAYRREYVNDVRDVSLHPHCSGFGSEGKVFGREIQRIGLWKYSGRAIQRICLWKYFW